MSFTTAIYRKEPALLNDIGSILDWPIFNRAGRWVGPSTSIKRALLSRHEHRRIGWKRNCFHVKQASLYCGLNEEGEMRNMKPIALLLGFLSAFPALAQSQTDIVAQASGSFRLTVMAKIVALEEKTGEFRLSFDGNEGGFFGCDGRKTSLKWSGLTKKVNDYPIYNFKIFPLLVQEVEVLSQEDFYCDVFSGKNAVETYQTYANLRKNVGKKLEMRIEGVVTAAILKNSKRIETVSLTSIEFHDKDRLITKFGRGKSQHGQANLSWVGIEG